MAGARASIGVIGGSGLYAMPGLTDVEEVTLATPFGAPSDAYTLGTLAGQRVAFLPRHGRGHRLLPTDVPVQANIYGFKMLGATHLLSVSAVGSMREEIRPLDLVVPDQLFDRTVVRPRTFFGAGLVVHVGFAEPFCPELRSALVVAAEGAGATVHRGGTYLCIEAPTFSTKAESHVYRSWGMDIIGMTNLQEAKLAREAEICYATLALVTDYDCWHEAHDAVSVETVVEYLNKNVRNAQVIMREAVGRLGRSGRGCACGSALKNAIFTPPELWPEATTKRLEAIIKKYVPQG